MINLEQVATSYGVTVATLTQANGQTHKATGSGGGLVASVEQLGLGGLAGSMAMDDQLVLEDEGVSLTLVREKNSARMRVSWTDGPTYEDHIETGTTASVSASDAPALSSSGPSSATLLFVPSL